MATFHAVRFNNDILESNSILGEYKIENSSDILTVLLGSDSLICAGLQGALKLSKFSVVARIDCIDGVDIHAASLPPRFLLIIDDSSTPKFLADPAAIGRLRKSYPLAVLAVIVEDNSRLEDSASLRSVNVIISYNASPEQLINVLDIAMDGVAILPMLSSVSSTVPDAMRHTPAGLPGLPLTLAPDLHRPLSAREEEILHYLCIGKSNKSIGATLSITEETVKTHIKGILRKISVNNRTEAAIWATRNLKQPGHL